MMITPSRALAYATLPRILPRLKTIGFNFSFVAAMMAALYGMVRLLPRDHAFLQPHTYGTYSVRQVLVESARYIRFDRAHLDQVVMFFILLAGFVLLVVQFVLLFIYLVMGVAYASGVGIFGTPDPTNDIAMVLLDRVFGLPGLFNSCISTTTVCDPTSTYITPYEPTEFPEPRHRALHAFFGFFSVGLGMVGIAIIVYYMIAVALESAQTGVPFGNRFASVYAPIRLCLAVLLLVPLPTPMDATGVAGYNTAQYLVLYLAKIGSNFGTNGWHLFNNALSTGGIGAPAKSGFGLLNPGAPDAPTNTNTGGNSGASAPPKGPGAALVAQPSAPVIDPLLQFMFIAHACRAMYILSDGAQMTVPDANGKAMLREVKPYIVTSDGFSEIKAATTYETALKTAKNSNIRVRFGVEDSDKGTIMPVCGELMMRVGDVQSPGSQYILNAYFGLIANMWENSALKDFGDRIAAMYLPNAGYPCAIDVPYVQEWGEDAESCGSGKASAWMPKSDYYNKVRDTYQATILATITTGREKQIEVVNARVDNKILNRGWAGAGIWYNRLAGTNGTLFDASKSLPTIVRMPEIMESVMKQRKSATNQGDARTRFLPTGSDGNEITGSNYSVAYGLNAVYMYFQGDGIARADISTKNINPIFDLMNRLFGTGPLFEMRKSQDVNPLVQMIAMGKSILDAAFFNILVGGGIEFAGGILQQLGGWQSNLGAGLNTLGDAWFSVAMIGLSIGITLYYVIPFLPFIYFFFSVIKWLQSIFEAMVGVPLWALAHLRIDEDGIPTEAAEGGYFLLLEIVLRPILTVIGMIASFVIFTGMVYSLNDIFNLLMVNLAGYDPPSTGSMDLDMSIKRGTIDQFFYTVMYAVLVYIFAVSSFKLIDMIPANILRWIGSSAKNIIDETGDPAADLIKSTYIGAFGMPLVQQGGMLGDAVKGVRQAIEGAGAAAGQSIQSTLKKD